MATKDTIKLVEEAGVYKYGFTTDIEQEFAPKGLNENIIKFISQKKKEPKWLLEWRMKAFLSWKKKESLLPGWANLKYKKIDWIDDSNVGARSIDKQTFIKGINKVIININ